MSDWSIELSGSALLPAYLVYVIKLVYEGKEWFYVGQTGDRKALSARPPFSRLAGHLNKQSRSTENQVYRFVREKLGDPDKVLSKARIEMKSYQIWPFDPRVEMDSHYAKRRDAEQMEAYVIQAFLGASKQLMNIKSSALPKSCPRPDILQQIKSDFDLS